MFDIGFTELMLLGVVALLVLGPERLPAAARTAGALLRRARNSYQTLKTDIERELAADEMRASAKAMQEPLQSIKDTAKELNRGAAELSAELKRSDPIAELAPAPATEADKRAAAEVDADDALAAGRVTTPAAESVPPADAQLQSKAKPRTKPKARAKAEPKTKTEAKPKPRSKPKLESKPTAKAKPSPKTKPKPKPKPSGDNAENAG